jgi:hypothetical protein
MQQRQSGVHIRVSSRNGPLVRPPRYGTRRSKRLHAQKAIQRYLTCEKLTGLCKYLSDSVVPSGTFQLTFAQSHRVPDFGNPPTSTMHQGLRPILPFSCKGQYRDARLKQRLQAVIHPDLRQKEPQLSAHREVAFRVGVECGGNQKFGVFPAEKGRCQCLFNKRSSSTRRNIF